MMNTLKWFKIKLRAFVMGISLFFPAITTATTFSANIETSQWYLASSIFECSLTHNIPNFGKGVFYREAGEHLKFILTAADNPLRQGRAEVAIEPPSWKPGGYIKPLHSIQVSKGTHAAVVSYREATEMMRGLLDGNMPTLTGEAWYNKDVVRVKLNPVNFAGFYSDYQNCLAGLLPVNFRQVERSKVFFVTDKAILTGKDKQTLNNVITYVKADKTVSAIFVDGHTDSTGRRIYNRRLSKARAEVVTKYLLDRGVAAEMITTRYHGERYPVVKNDTKIHKAMNRRTTIRLERGEKIAQQ
jgi:outer membrane protein OmpA-like peptidoglycan-associated protein